MSASTRAERAEKELASWKRQNSNKGGGKGNDGKGGGKGGGKDTNSAGCHFRTPDGRQVCFGFNNKKEGCKRAHCHMAHVCGVCFKKDMPMHKCKHEGKA